MDSSKKVILQSEELGKREFKPEHAAKLLALQKRLQIDHWKPVKPPQSNEANRSASPDDTQNTE